MGAEWGQWNEWYHETSLDWHLLEQVPHQGVKHWVHDLNMLLRAEPALYELDFEPAGFEWIDFRDYTNSILSFVRKSKKTGEELLVICNFTPVPRGGYRAGVPHAGRWVELLNSDATTYGGSGVGNCGGVETEPVSYHGYDQSISLTLPPLGIVVFKGE